VNEITKSTTGGRSRDRTYKPKALSGSQNLRDLDETGRDRYLCMRAETQNNRRRGSISITDESRKTRNGDQGSYIVPRDCSGPRKDRHLPGNAGAMRSRRERYGKQPGQRWLREGGGLLRKPLESKHGTGREEYFVGQGVTR